MDVTEMIQSPHAVSGAPEGTFLQFEASGAGWEASVWRAVESLAISALDFLFSGMAYSPHPFPGVHFVFGHSC